MFGHYVLALPPGSTDFLSTSEYLDVEDLGRKAQLSGLSIVCQIWADMMAKFGEGAALSEPEAHNMLVEVCNDLYLNPIFSMCELTSPT